MMITCVLCGHTAERFKEAGVVRKRPNARCPVCGSYERHRLIGWHLQSQRMWRQGMRVLEVAPTPCLQQVMRTIGVEVTSIDLGIQPGAIQMNVECMSFPNASFDGILCVHVLEHVESDRRALQDLYRVLRPGGWAVLMVPIDESKPKTDEDPSITDSAERLRRFGQADHVRLYGADYVDRCRRAGFRMEIIAVNDPALVTRHAFMPGERLYIGWKDAALA